MWACENIEIEDSPLSQIAWKTQAPSNRSSGSVTEATSGTLIYELDGDRGRIQNIPFIWVIVFRWASDELTPQEVTDIFHSLKRDKSVISERKRMNDIIQEIDDASPDLIPSAVRILTTFVNKDGWELTDELTVASVSYIMMANGIDTPIEKVEENSEYNRESFYHLYTNMFSELSIETSKVIIDPYNITDVSHRPSGELRSKYVFGDEDVCFSNRFF